MKGRTRWFPRHVQPVRNGVYECHVHFTSIGPLMRYELEWDGTGFKVPFPMVVKRWRGLTKEAYKAEILRGAKFRPVAWSDLGKEGAPTIGWGIERKGPGERYYKAVGYEGQLHPFKSKAEAMAKCKELMQGGARAAAA